MPNDSSTGGFLAPTSLAPLYDQALDEFFQALVVGITGLAGNLVRPRWQPDPPNLPPFGTDWAAVGVSKLTGDTYAQVEHDGAGNGTDIVTRHETLEVACSFYGADAGGNASLLRDGLGAPQNREILFLNNMALIESQEPARVPELIKGRWLNRVDLTVVFRREVDRTYPVLNLESLAGTVATDATTVSIAGTPA